MNNEPKTAKLEFVVRGEPLFYYGQKLFAIYPTNSKRFFEPCPVCDDSQKVKIRDFEFECPACRRNSTYSGERIKNDIVLSDYKIIEYIVNEVEIKGPNYKSAFSGETEYFDLPFASFKAFERSGNGYNNVSSKNVSNSSFSIDPSEDTVVESECISGYFFTKKKFAMDAIKPLKERDRSLLKQFNEEHGTNYEYPF